MSIGFLLRDRDDAIIWRGPRKFGAIQQFLQDVEWGELDYLIVDSPPGTGDEPLAVAQLIDHPDGAIVVTTPQEVAVQDVRRCIMFCRQLELTVLGVVENMSGFTCPKCGELVRIFGADGGRAMAEEMGVPYLGAIPIEPELSSPATAALRWCSRGLIRRRRKRSGEWFARCWSPSCERPRRVATAASRRER